VSAFNGGIALGSAIGGHTLDTSLAETGPAAFGIVMALLSLIPLIAIAMNGAGRTNTSRNHQCLPSGVAQGAHV
jgi:DHA1 family inner membrane transport protein